MATKHTSPEQIINTTAYSVWIEYTYSYDFKEWRGGFETNTKAMDYLKDLAKRAIATNTPVYGTVTSSKRECTFAIQYGTALLVWDDPESVSGQCHRRFA